MSESEPRPDIPPPGGVAWLDVSAQTADSWPGRIRTGPLGLQISPLAGARAPYFFKGARLRGARCIWSASTVSGAELSRRARPPASAPDTAVHLLVRAECAGSVFDPVGQLSRGTLKVLDPGHEIREQFVGEHAPVHAERPARDDRRRAGDAGRDDRSVLRPDRVPGAAAAVGGRPAAQGRATSSTRRRRWSASIATSARWPGCCCARPCASRAPRSSRWSRSGRAPTRSSSSRPPTRS